MACTGLIARIEHCGPERESDLPEGTPQVDGAAQATTQS